MYCIWGFKIVSLKMNQVTQTINQFFLQITLYFQGCDLGRYSNGCTKDCPSKCNGACDAFNGSCIHGCSDPNALTIDCIGKPFFKMFFFIVKEWRFRRFVFNNDIIFYNYCFKGAWSRFWPKINFSILIFKMLQ